MLLESDLQAIPIKDLDVILSTFKVPTPNTPDGIVDAIASAVEGARAGHEIGRGADGDDPLQVLRHAYGQFTGQL